MQSEAMIGHTQELARVNASLQELTPLIYTPVVGEACQRWSEIYQQAEGAYSDSQCQDEDEPAR